MNHWDFTFWNVFFKINYYKYSENGTTVNELGLCFYSQLTAIVVHASLFSHGHLEMEQKADGA